MYHSIPKCGTLGVALLAEGVDRNFFDRMKSALQKQSPSLRRAWIEISSCSSSLMISGVALLAEGVDRNTPDDALECPIDVALLAEGVDRNIKSIEDEQTLLWSPSLRRAWIEISASPCTTAAFRVALLAEGVDRNSPPSAQSRSW